MLATMQAIQPGKYEPSTLNEGERLQPVNAKSSVDARLAERVWRHEYFSGLVFLVRFILAQIILVQVMDGTFGMLTAADRPCDRQSLRGLLEALFARRHHC